MSKTPLYVQLENTANIDPKKQGGWPVLARPELLEWAKEAKYLQAHFDMLVLLTQEDGFPKLTEGIDEHPEGYEGPCFCELCRSYAD